MDVVTDTGFLGLPLFRRGKVRDIYEVGDLLLVISTDRISAFDVIMEEGVPGKGEVLNRVAAFWLNETSDIIANHLVTTDMDELPASLKPFKSRLQGRSMLVVKAEPLPVEAVVRGYLAGSGWKDYLETGAICGIRLPGGLRQADRLPGAIFTPSTKAEIGDHDENVPMDAVVEAVGDQRAKEIERASLALYARGREIAESHGIILADTKFEFGMYDGGMILIDEVFTPDSSRFWPKEGWEPGRSQENLDKQVLRDYLETLDWDKRPPPPKLPAEVIRRVEDTYRHIGELILSEG